MVKAETENKISSYNTMSVLSHVSKNSKRWFLLEGKAVKFGGTSLCDARQMQKAADIVRADEKRKAVVVSAPGKRSRDDEKITDLFIACHHVKDETRREALFSLIQSRFDGIIAELRLPLDFSEEYKTMRTLRGDALVSRGEYFSARIFAALLDYTFADAAACIFFRADGTTDERRTRAALTERLARAPKGIVVPGFYGSTPYGGIRLFSRGGSDITGAIVADATDADIYENFTDVRGFLLADPHIVKDAVTVPLLSYRELRYLSAKGAGVLHADAILPLRKRQIPTVIRCTDDPHGPHTWIVPHKERGVGGIVGSTGYTLFGVERTHVGDDPAAIGKIASLLSREGFAPLFLSQEPDTVTFLLRHCDFARADALAVALQNETDAEIVTVRGGLAEVAVAAEGFTPEMRAAVWRALETSGVRPCFALCGNEAFSLTVGVQETELHETVRRIHESLAPFVATPDA